MIVYRGYQVAAAVFLLVTISAVIPAMAWAHAELERSDPPPGANLGQSPHTLYLFFSEAPSPSFSKVQVLNETRQPIDAGDGHVAADNPQMMTVSLPDSLPHGLYTVAWRTVSAVDGHPAEGAYQLSIGPMSSESMAMAMPMPAATMSSDHAFSVEPAVARWWFSLAASLLFGTILIWRLVFRPLLEKRQSAAAPVAAARARRLASVAGMVLLIGTLYGALAQAAAAADVPLWGAVGRPLFDLLSSGRYAELWWFRLIYVLIALGLVSRGGVSTLSGEVALISTGLALLTSSLNSHAAGVASGGYLAVLADWLHFLGVATWFGGLACLAYVLPVVASAPDGRQILARAVQRFSSLALVSVGVIVLTGVFEAWLLVGSWEGMLQTAYGLSLTAKAGLLLVTLLFAGFNLAIARPALARVAARQSAAAATTITRHFFTSIRVEIGLISLILVAAAVLTGFAPAREELARRSGIGMVPGQVDRKVTVAGSDVAIQISPGTLGPNHFLVRLPDDINPRHVERVQLTMSYLDSDMGSQPLVMSPSASQANTWEATSTVLSQPGAWQAALLVRQMAKDDLRSDIQFTVNPSQQPMHEMPAEAQIYPVLPSPFQSIAYLLLAVGLILVVALLVLASRVASHKRREAHEAARSWRLDYPER